jgi:hypothetical protein
MTGSHHGDVQKRDTDEPVLEVCLVVRPNLLPGFCSLLQQGVGVISRMGLSVKAFLCDELGLSPEFLDSRIQTVFLDGKAVDDLESAVIHEGAVLALSAAMPGLLGATLRRGSYYAAMRGEISYRGQREAVSGRPGVIWVKLFNLLVCEIGPVLLSRGGRIAGTDLREFLKSRPARFWSDCMEAAVNGRGTDPKSLLAAEWPPEPLLLKVNPA